jgi:hypothetical protein
LAGCHADPVVAQQDTDRRDFTVIEGDLSIDFRNGPLHLSARERVVVPRAVEHPMPNAR